MRKSQAHIARRAEITRLMDILGTHGFPVEAHGNAQRVADESSLPMTVFYMPNHGYSFANETLHPIFGYKPEMLVTWLPSGYFS